MIDWLNCCLSLQVTQRLMAIRRQRAWETCRITRSRSTRRPLLRESVDSVYQRHHPHCIRLRALTRWLHLPIKCAAPRDSPWRIFQPAAVRPVPYRCLCPPHLNAAFTAHKTRSCKLCSSNNPLLLLAVVRQRKSCARREWAARQMHHALSTNSNHRHYSNNIRLLYTKIILYFIQN